MKKLTWFIFLIGFLKSDTILNIAILGGTQLELDFLNNNFLSKEKDQQAAAATGLFSSLFNNNKTDVHTDILDFFKKNHAASINNLPINCSLLIAISELIDDCVELGFAIFWMNIPNSEKIFHYLDKDNKTQTILMIVNENNLIAIGPQFAFIIDDTITIRIILGITPSHKSSIQTQQQFSPSVEKAPTTPTDSSLVKSTIEDHSINITNSVQSIISDNFLLTALLSIGISLTDDIQLIFLIGGTIPLMNNHGNHISTFAENNAIERNEAIVFSCTQHKIIVQAGINWQIRNSN